MQRLSQEESSDMDNGDILGAGAILVAAYLGIGIDTLNAVFRPVRQSYPGITGAVLWSIVKKLEEESEDIVTLAKEIGIDSAAIVLIQGEMVRIKTGHWS